MGGGDKGIPVGAAPHGMNHEAPRQILWSAVVTWCVCRIREGQGRKVEMWTRVSGKNPLSVQVSTHCMQMKQDTFTQWDDMITYPFGEASSVGLRVWIETEERLGEGNDIGMCMADAEDLS